jgi:hypothetical protein
MCAEKGREVRMKALVFSLMILVSCGKDPAIKKTSHAEKASAPILKIDHCEEERLRCQLACPSSPFNAFESCANSCWGGKENCVREGCENYCGEIEANFSKYEDCRNQCIEENKVIKF